MTWELIGLWSSRIGYTAVIIMLWAETIEAVAKGNAGTAAFFSPPAVIATAIVVTYWGDKWGWW